MAVKTTEELKGMFQRGKYPTQDAYEHLIDTMTSQQGFLTLRVTDSFELYYEEHVFELFGQDENGNQNPVPVGTVVIVNNVSDKVINVGYEYDTGLSVAIQPKHAVMFIKSNEDSYNGWGIVSNPIN